MFLLLLLFFYVATILHWLNLFRGLALFIMWKSIDRLNCADCSLVNLHNVTSSVVTWGSDVTPFLAVLLVVLLCRFKQKKWTLKFRCPYFFLVAFLWNHGCHWFCSVCHSAATVFSFFVLSFAFVDIFTTFIHDYSCYVHIDTVCLIHKSENSHDIFIVRKFAQLHDDFHCYINLMLWEGSL